jgi:uncharacterized membrane protein YkvI
VVAVKQVPAAPVGVTVIVTLSPEFNEPTVYKVGVFATAPTFTGAAALTWYEIVYPVALVAAVQLKVTDVVVEVPQLIILLEDAVIFTTIATLVLSQPARVWLT